MSLNMLQSQSRQVDQLNDFVLDVIQSHSRQFDELYDFVLINVYRNLYPRYKYLINQPIIFWNIQTYDDIFFVYILGRMPDPNTFFLIMYTNDDTENSDQNISVDVGSLQQLWDRIPQTAKSYT